MLRLGFDDGRAGCVFDGIDTAVANFVLLDDGRAHCIFAHIVTAFVKLPTLDDGLAQMQFASISIQPSSSFYSMIE